MSCPMMRSSLEPIADELLDKSLVLYPRHTVYTHLGCALLRMAMGLLLIGWGGSNETIRNVIIVIMILAILVFGKKYKDKIVDGQETYWKSYPRMLVAYSSALALVKMKEEKLAGLVVMADALMGMNSRHTSSVLSCGIKKETKP